MPPSNTGIPPASASFSWLRTRKLAIGPMPQTSEQWQVLVEQGIRSVMSCCDPEEGNWQPPPYLPQIQRPLPDHRNPGAMQSDLLDQAINSALDLYESTPALYLHCWAGLERSPLIAVGLLCRAESLPFFDALAQVRAMHPPARPITRHLMLLETLLSR